MKNVVLVMKLLMNVLRMHKKEEHSTFVEILKSLKILNSLRKVSAEKPQKESLLKLVNASLSIMQLSVHPLVNAKLLQSAHLMLLVEVMETEILVK
jgi:hypothetical protein